MKLNINAIWMLAFVYGCLVFDVSIAQLPKCEQKKTCGDCISSADCFWCLDSASQVSPFVQKCFSIFQESPCSESGIVDPRDEEEILENIEVNPNSQNDDIVHIAPQKVKLRLRLVYSLS